MAYEFRLQDPGEGIHEAEIIEINVSEGQQVREGENILVAETDKAAVDIPSPVTGEIVELKVSEGDIVEVGSVLAVLNEEGSEKDEEPDPDEGSDADEGADKETGKSRNDQPAREGGNKSKTEAASSSRAAGESSRAEAQTTDADQADVLATPAVRGLARDLGIDLEDVPGSGEDGRILEDDVQKVAEPDSASKDDDTDIQAVRRPTEGSERVKLRSVRRSTARRMAQSWRDIPHVTHEDAIDITDLERMRRDHVNTAKQEGVKLTLTPFVMKALAGSLSQHPSFNARFDADEEEIEIFHEVNVGVALDTERGLLVPVVRDVQAKTVLELAKELSEISEKLQEKRADRAMLEGGTVTVTNIGAIGGTGLSPIINPPQVAIFGVARAKLQAVLSGDIDEATSQNRLILPVCLTFDHRVNDGADAARFMNSVKLLLSDPEQFALRS